MSAHSNNNSIKAHVLIVYHSMQGHTKRMAEVVADGARSVEGTQVIVKSVDEVQRTDFQDCDALILGSPVHQRMMGWEMKRFIDLICEPSWFFDDMVGRVGGVFTTGGGHGNCGAGAELAQLGLLVNLASLGMVLVTLPKTTPGFNIAGMHWVGSAPPDGRATDGACHTSPDELGRARSSLPPWCKHCARYFSLAGSKAHGSRQYLTSACNARDTRPHGGSTTAGGTEMNDERFSHHTIQANDIRLHYVIGGTGTPVLLWHGFLETWYCWRKIMPTLAKHYTVIAPDMRGYGDSDKPDDGYDARTLVEDFRQLVAQLGFRQLHLVAHDMGAPPALLYAAQYSEQVLSLTYLEEPVLLSQVLQQVFQFTPEATPAGGLWWWTFALAQNLPETLITGHEREFITYFYNTYCHNPSAIAPDVIDEYMRSFAAPKGVSGALGVYRAVFESIKQTEALAQNKLKIPILALGGDQVLGDRVKTMLQNVAENVRGGAIEQCGHFVADERPDYLAKQLIAFFNEVQHPAALSP